MERVKPLKQRASGPCYRYRLVIVIIDLGALRVKAEDRRSGGQVFIKGGRLLLLPGLWTTTPITLTTPTVIFSRMIGIIINNTILLELFKLPLL